MGRLQTSGGPVQSKRQGHGTSEEKEVRQRKCIIGPRKTVGGSSVNCFVYTLVDGDNL